MFKRLYMLLILNILEVTKYLIFNRPVTTYMQYSQNISIFARNLQVIWLTLLMITKNDTTDTLGIFIRILSKINVFIVI